MIFVAPQPPDATRRSSRLPLAMPLRGHNRASRTSGTTRSIGRSLANSAALHAVSRCSSVFQSPPSARTACNTHALESAALRRTAIIDPVENEREDLVQDVELTTVTEGMIVRTADLERLCERRDPRAVEFACFLLHSSKGDAGLAAYRAIDGMFDDPNVRAIQRETAECVREVALAALDLKLSLGIEHAIARCWTDAEQPAAS